MDNSDWFVAGRPKKDPRHFFTVARAEAFEREMNIRNLAASLRSEEVNKLLVDGWEFAGVVRGGETMPLFDEHYIYHSVVIEGNRWSDSVLLRQTRGGDWSAGSGGGDGDGDGDNSDGGGDWSAGDGDGDGGGDGGGGGGGGDDGEGGDGEGAVALVEDGGRR